MNALYRLRAILKPYLSHVSANLFLLLIGTALALLVPRIIQDVIDTGIISGQVETLIRSALLLMGIGAVAALVAFGQRYLTEWIAAHVGYDLRNRMYDHIQHQSFTYHDHNQTGQLISRCIEDVRAVERFAGEGVIEIIQLILLIGGITAIMFTENAKLAGISLLPMIPLVVIALNFGRQVTRLFYEVDTILGDLSARLQENVTGVQVVRAFAREDHEMNVFDRINRSLYNSRIKVIGAWAKVMPTTNWLIVIGTIGILWFGGRMVIEGTMTVGEVVAFNSYLLLLAQPAQRLTWFVNHAGEAEAGARRVLDVLDHQPSIQAPPGVPPLPPLSGRVEFKNVSLYYQDEKVSALSNINLVVEPNQIIALIGRTGSGKTSLVNLIPRFYDVSNGQVLVDDHDVSKVDLISLRKQIGIVLQTSLLFSDSIRANIAYGVPDADEVSIIAAANAAQAHDFIMKLADGYDTVIGERGITLSGGQRQRVAIARALLMDPRILIMDDSTSSVDTETEKLIQQVLERLMEGRTTFVIAHRLATVRRADMILVMDNGQIVEKGHHKELLAQEGLYHEIYEMQLKDKNRYLQEVEELEAEVDHQEYEKITSKEDMG